MDGTQCRCTLGGTPSPVPSQAHPGLRAGRPTAASFWNPSDPKLPGDAQGSLLFSAMSGNPQKTCNNKRKFNAFFRKPDAIPIKIWYLLETIHLIQLSRNKDSNHKKGQMSTFSWNTETGNYGHTGSNQWSFGPEALDSRIQSLTVSFWYTSLESPVEEI